MANDKSDDQIVAEYSRGHQIGEKSFDKRTSLTTVVAELDRQLASKIDFVADTRSMKFGVAEDKTVRLYANSAQVSEYLPKDGLVLTYDCLAQAGNRMSPDIPSKFLRDLVAQQPDLAADLMTELFHRTPARRMIRCLDNRVRAVLSNRYRILDNRDFAMAALDAARAHDGEVLEAQLTDRHMRLKLTTRKVFDVIETTRDKGGNWFAGALGNQQLLGRVAATRWDDLPGGPGTVTPLVSISNSETGYGGTRVRIGILMGVCFNLATVENVVAERHLGGEIDEGLLSEETHQADARAVMLKLRDYVTTAFEPSRFKALVEKVKMAQEDVIKAPTMVVDSVMGALKINAEHRDSLLSYFIRDYDPTRFGLAQAVSRLAQDVESPDLATEWEDAAGRLLVTPELVAV